MVGVLAQLVERLVRNEKVRSSSLLGSTSFHFPLQGQSLKGRHWVSNRQALLPMPSRHSEAIIFSVKAMVGTVVAALSYKFFDLPGAPWVAAVSAVLVTQPNLHSSLKASMLRVTANVAGAFGGAVLLAITRQPIAAMAIGHPHDPCAGGPIAPITQPDALTDLDEEWLLGDRAFQAGGACVEI